MAKKKNLLNDAFVQSKGGWKAGNRGIQLSKTRWQGPKPKRSFRLSQSFKGSITGSVAGGYDPKAGWKIVGLILACFLIAILISGFFYHAPVYATTSYNAASHTRTPIYSTPNPFASGTGGLLNTWNFNYTNSPSRSDVCIGLQSGQQLRFKYDLGKTATSYGPFTFAATDYGNGIDVQQQQKLFYALGNWWAFWINSSSGKFIVFSASQTGGNGTGSWRAGGTFAAVAGAGQFSGQKYSTTTYQAEAGRYAVWHNSTDVYIVYEAAGNAQALKFVRGTLNSAGTITFDAARTIATPAAGFRFELPQVIVYPTSPFIAVVTVGLNDIVGGTFNQMWAYYSLNNDFSSWASSTLKTASGGQIVHTAWYSFNADLLNGSLYLAYSSSNGDYSGVQGTYARIFTRPSTFGSEETIASNNNIGWFPYGLIAIASNDIVAAFVNGTGSNLNQVFLFNERINGAWRYGSSTFFQANGVPGTYDLSSGAMWDSSAKQFYYINQITAGPGRGISGWWNSTASTNSNKWTNKAVDFKTNNNETRFFQMTSPTDGNVSSRYNRMNQDLTSVTVTDGNVRAGTFWTEGNGAAPVDANAYRLVFGSILMPQGRNQFGNNCNSADIAILKAPVNLQIASGKQLELLWSWGCTTNGVKAGCLDTIPDFSSVDFILRTNGTLPGWQEGWIPENDPTVRMIDRMFQRSDGTFGQVVYVAKGQGASILSEGYASDQIGNSAQNVGFGNICPSGGLKVFNQAILNFSGPNSQLDNEILGTGSCAAGLNIFAANTIPASCGGLTCSTGTASNLQQGQDYYLTVKVSWGLNLDPVIAEGIDFRTGDAESTQFGQNGGNIVPTTSAIYSTPPQAEDKANIAFSSTPVFQVNPLDPSSWGNAIIKGMQWVFTSIFASLGQMFQYLAPIFVSTLNAMGSFLGIGPIGTSIVSFFFGIGAWITNIFGFVFSSGANVVAFLTNGISFLNLWLTGFFSNASSSITAFLAIFGFLGPVWNLVVVSGHISITTLISLDLFWGMWQAFRSYSDWLGWFRMNEMLFLKIFKAIYWIGDEVFKLISRIRNIAPRPLGT